MYAIVIFAGAQYLVTRNSVLELAHKITNTPPIIWITKVLLVATKKHTIIGYPTIKEAYVVARVIQNKKRTLLHIQEILV